MQTEMTYVVPIKTEMIRTSLPIFRLGQKETMFVVELQYLDMKECPDGVDTCHLFLCSLKAGCSLRLFE